VLPHRVPKIASSNFFLLCLQLGCFIQNPDSTTTTQNHNNRH
jgi:hypothetical protein